MPRPTSIPPFTRPFPASQEALKGSLAKNLVVPIVARLKTRLCPAYSSKPAGPRYLYIDLLNLGPLLNFDSRFVLLNIFGIRFVPLPLSLFLLSVSSAEVKELFIRTRDLNSRRFEYSTSESSIDIFDVTKPAKLFTFMACRPCSTLYRNPSSRALRSLRTCMVFGEFADPPISMSRFVSVAMASFLSNDQR